MTVCALTIIFALMLTCCMVFIVDSCRKEKNQSSPQHHSPQGTNPTACFTVIDSVTVIYDTVYFTNCSSNADSLVYNFGDGQSSDSINPKHLYTTAGTYHAKLVAYNGSDSSVMSKTITVKQGIYGTFTAVDSTCLGSNPLIVTSCNCSTPSTEFAITTSFGFSLGFTFGQGLNFSTYTNMPGDVLFFGNGSFSSNLDTMKLNLTTVSTNQIGQVTENTCNAVYARN